MRESLVPRVISWLSALGDCEHPWSKKSTRQFNETFTSDNYGKEWNVYGEKREPSIPHVKRTEMRYSQVEKSMLESLFIQAISNPKNRLRPIPVA